jgi:undecaprenyl-diphosphatase
VALRVIVLVAAWLALTGLLIAVGFAVLHSSTVGRFDRHVTATVVAHRTSALNAAMKVCTWLGSWVALVVTGVLLFVLALRGRIAWLAVVLAVVAWGGETGAVHVAKEVVQRARPPQRIWLKTAHGWSWPSGHMAVAVVVFSVLALVVTHLSGSTTVRASAWALAVLAMAIVGFSRIELGVHWTTDVIGSLVFVALWLVAVVAIFRGELGASRQGELRT